MRKILIASSLSLFAVIATAAAQAPNPPAARPQADRAQADRPVPPGRGRGAPNPAAMAEQRGQRCQNGYAMTAARLAYLEARLNLTGAQSAAFARWRDIRLAAAKRQADSCATMRGGRGANATPPTPVERLAREETRLQNRLADIRAERPVLEALTSALSPEQRQTLARTALAGGPGLPMQGGMTMNRNGGPRGNMMFRRGPMGRGDMPPPDAPPPPR